MSSPYQLANIDSSKLESQIDSQNKVQSSNLETIFQKAKMKEELERLISQASNRKTNIFDFIPVARTIKDASDRRKIYKKASNIDSKYGNTFLSSSSSNFLDQVGSLQTSPLEFGQNILSDMMGFNLTKKIFANFMKHKTPLKSIISNIENLDLKKDESFNNMAMIQKLLSMLK